MCLKRLSAALFAVIVTSALLAAQNTKELLKPTMTASKIVVREGG